MSNLNQTQIEKLNNIDLFDGFAISNGQIKGLSDEVQSIDQLIEQGTSVSFTGASAAAHKHSVVQIGKSLWALHNQLTGSIQLLSNVQDIAFKNNRKVIGTTGHDLISGSHTNDIIRGGEGNDRIIGEHGNDTLHGEAGPPGLMFTRPTS